MATANSTVSTKRAAKAAIPSATAPAASAADLLAIADEIFAIYNGVSTCAECVMVAASDSCDFGESVADLAGRELARHAEALFALQKRARQLAEGGAA
jgi:hypothetical protein